MSQSARRAAVFAVFFPFVWLYRNLFRKHWQAIDDAYRTDNAEERAAEEARAARTSEPEPSKGKGKGKGKGKKRRAGGRKRGQAGAGADSSADSGADSSADLSADSSADLNSGSQGASPSLASYDWRPLCILIVVAMTLTLQEYFGKRATYLTYFPYDSSDANWQLGLYLWTSGWRVLCYVVIPILAIALMPGERLRDYYLRRAGARKHLWLYAVAVAVMALVILDSVRDSSFYRFYLFDRLVDPLAGQPGASGEHSSLDFWVWLIALPVQFAALEFFFRGFMLHGLRRSLGSKAIFVMMVPYCMIHYSKPFPPFAELLTAIVAAIVLGTLAMRTRSIWGAVIIHMAGSMTLSLADIDHRILLGIAVPLLWLFRTTLRDHWQAIDADYRRDFARPAEDTAEDTAENIIDGGPSGGTVPPDALVAGPYDWRPLCVLLVVAISLSLQEGYGQRSTYRQYFPADEGGEYWQLGAFMWWSGWRVFGYIILPVVAILLMPGERVRDYYISFIGFFKHLWIYAVLFLAILPAVIIAAQTEAFYGTYPFYKLANRSSFDFWAWEFFYVIQFLSLEFFFRGFMLHGLRRSMGSMAVFVMLVSYCMIHYGKPFPETMGAIFAGLILGTLAMRTRSIWGGVLIHAGVAVSMDALAIDHCPSAESGLPCKGH